MARDEGKSTPRQGRLYARSRRLATERRRLRGSPLPEGPVRGWRDPWEPRTTEGEAVAGRGHVGGDDFRDLEHFGMGTGIRTTRPGRG
jgi:hypothetical protein